MAKTGLLKKYIKLAGGSFAKAWKLQKAACKKRKSSKKTTKKTIIKKVTPKKTRKKKTTIKKPTLRKVVTMAKKKNTTRRKPRVSAGKIQKVIMSGAAATAGAIGAGVAANYIPMPNPKIKAAIPIVAGIMLASTKIGRSAMMQTVATGMIAAGALALTKQLAPNVPLLAGEDEIEFIPSNYEEDAMLGYSQPEMLGESVYVGDEIDDAIEDELSGEAYDVAGEFEAYPGEF